MKKLFLLSAAGLLFLASCRTYCPAYGHNDAPETEKAQAANTVEKSEKANS